MPGDLFAYGGGGDVWNGLALSNLNMNGFSILNINTITLNQTAVAGCGVAFTRNLAAAQTDSPILCVWDQNAGDDQPAQRIIQDGTGTGLFIDSNGGGRGIQIDSEATVVPALEVLGTLCAYFTQDLTNGTGLRVYRNLNEAGALSLAYFICDHASNTQPVITIQQDGTGMGIALAMNGASGTAFDIDQNADGYGINIVSSATTNTMYALRCLTGSGATVADFEYTGNEFIRLGMHNDANGTSWFYRNLAAADTAGPVVNIVQDNGGDDAAGIALKIQQDGTGHYLALGTQYVFAWNGLITQTPIATTSYDYYIASSQISGVGLRIDANALTTGSGLQINNSGANCSGQFFKLATESTNNVLTNRVNDWAYWTCNRIEQRTAGTTTDDFDMAHIYRITSTTGVGGTLSSSGSILKLHSYVTQTAGTLTADFTALEIAHITRSASLTWAIDITHNNDGAGDPGAIKMTSFSAGEPLFGVPVDTGGVGVPYGRIIVYVDGVGNKALLLAEVA